MRSNSKVKVQAKTLDKALLEAASQLGVKKEGLQYNVLSQTDGGILSFLGARRVEIEAWSDAAPRSTSSRSRRPERSERSERSERPARSPRPNRSAASAQEAKQDLTDEEMTKLCEDLRSFCAGICRFIANEDVEVLSTIEDGRLVLDIRHEDIANQILKNSKIAESMEHILRKKPRYLKRELPFRIFIDVNGQRKERENELINMAQDLSMKVFENQKPIVLNYKSSYDRKIIHMALDQDERVYTKSIGSGTNRKLMILPIKADGAVESRDY